MRSRSHRLQVSEPRHDDWVDGSWTVDCVCGVNFDDGEEMVDCDECGVWVHTRCARYVKSDKSFACDKCKSKNSGGGSSSGVRNDSEETEVAEFLVELPTKTLRMDNPNPANLSARRPFRLWTDIPMEDRVHVQGVPDGESGLFSGVKMSSVFGPELWKCTGYVPKKFNFRYNEFECLDPGKDEEKREEKDKTMGQENAKQTDSRAGVLFSLLTVNENTLPSPAVNSVGVSKSPIEGGGSHEVESPPQQKLDTQNVVSECPGEGIKENNSVRIVLHTGKRKKEEQQKVKDQYVKKKVRTTEKEGDRRATHGSKAVVASTFSSDAKHLKFSRDRGSKAASDDIKCGKNILRDQLSVNLGECATNLASNEHSVEATLRNDVSSDEISTQGNSGNGVPAGSESFSKTNNGLESLVDINGSHIQSMSIKEEVPGEILQRCGDASDNGRVGIDSRDKEPVAAEVKIADPEAKESEDDRDSDVGEANSHPNKKLKSEKNAGDHELQHSQSLPSNDAKSDTIKATTQYPESLVNKVYPDEGKVVEASVMNAEASDQKAIGGSRSRISGSSRTEKSQLNDPYQSKREPSGSEGSMGARKKFSLLKNASEVTDELLKSNGTARSYSTSSYRREAVVSLVKSTSNSGATVPKSSENHMVPTSPVPPVHIRQKESSQNSMGTMKDNISANAVEHDGKSSRPRKLVKESSRLNSLSKISESTKLSQMSDSRKLPSDLKDSRIHSSSKVPLPANGASSHISGESGSPPPQGDDAANVQNKAAASADPGKGEKLHQSGHTSSRGNVASVTTPASSHIPATLSDEELALLLHQELNSSPRVPRVPRMRHAGSLPQLSSSTATSMLMKRTCSGGTKDNSMGPRRRTKDGEGSHGSVDVNNEARKMDRKPSLPDSRRQDSGCSVDPLSRRESMQPMKKLSSTLSSSGDANGHTVSSTRALSRNASDEDLHAVGHHTNRTLPGLIAEIMSEGKRMTYEELCNAVLPHWPHLRKHNGERYAYSSHSQAVLDCLRNRSEWARLVDRGPKTSASRKRRKLDTDSMSIESQDDEENRGKNAKDVGSKSFESHHEDFPKGKRKARKRRRLALQGRRVVRRRRRAEVVSDDESESFSDSSEESESSEEEIQGGGASMGGSESSTSSDE